MKSKRMRKAVRRFRCVEMSILFSVSFMPASARTCTISPDSVWFKSDAISFQYPANWDRAPDTTEREVEFRDRNGGDYGCSMHISAREKRTHAGVSHGAEGMQDLADYASSDVPANYSQLTGAEVGETTFRYSQTPRAAYVLVGWTRDGRLEYEHLFVSVEQYVLEFRFSNLTNQQQSLLLDRLISSVTVRPQNFSQTSTHDYAPKTSTPVPVNGCPAAPVDGNWRGTVVTDAPWNAAVDVAFSFAPDGSYSYSAGQGNFVWTEHRGRYQNIPTADESARSYPCTLILQPDSSTIQVNRANPLGLAPLQARNLMDNERHSFRLSSLNGRLIFQDTALSWKDVGMFGLDHVQ